MAYLIGYSLRVISRDNGPRPVSRTERSPNQSTAEGGAMADLKTTHSQDIPTRQDFPEARDKIDDIVELTAEADYYRITIRFQDSTTLTFVIEPCVAAFPIYSNWTDGEEKILKQYQPSFGKVPKM